MVVFAVGCYCWLFLGLVVVVVGCFCCWLWLLVVVGSSFAGLLASCFGHSNDHNNDNNDCNDDNNACCLSRFVCRHCYHPYGTCCHCNG